LSASWKPLWIALTDARKIARERRTILLTIALPVIVVIVVGVTFSLGYQQFEKKELAIGVVKHRNSTYAQMIVDGIEQQNAMAIVYETVEDAREDLVAEKIDSIIEVDPWIAEKMSEFKRSWIRIHADETRPLLTAAIEVTMLQAKEDVVDELAWEYVKIVKEQVVPGLVEALGSIEAMFERGQSGEDIRDALDLLARIESVDDEAIRSMVGATETGFREIMQNGTPYEKVLISMIDQSAVVGTLRGLSDSKPLLDACYHFLRYAYPHLGDPGALPSEIAKDLSGFTGNLSRIDSAQAIAIKIALPYLRDRLIETLSSENPNKTEDEIRVTAEMVLGSASSLMDVVMARESEIANLNRRVSGIRTQLESVNLTQLVTEGKGLVEKVGGMEKAFLTSPLYLTEMPLYFGETKRYVDYISPGIFAFGILFSVLVYTVLSVVRDREKGILRRIFLCNVGRWTYVGGKCIVCLGIAAVQIIILTACAVLLFDIYIISLPKTFLFGLYASVGFVGLGLLISTVSKTELEALTASFGLCFIMLMISGVFYPFELSPSVVRQASRYVPITYVADLLKAGMIKDSTLGEVLGNLVSVGAYGGLTLLVGALAFSWRKKG